MKSLLRKWVAWATRKFTSRPSRTRIFSSLNQLFSDIEKNPGKRGLLVPFNVETDRFILFSDQHKGAGDGADDFRLAAPTYLAALDYYLQNDFRLINLGDNEELWENTLGPVKKFHAASFAAERAFAERNAFIKVIGNHDLFWLLDPFAWWQIKELFSPDLKIYEGLILHTMVEGKPFRIYCTHGHQGDLSSDGNWFSKTFVSRIWAPLQSWLNINPNTPAYDNEKKTLHNEMMYQWAVEHNDGILITGHTHQPVFESLTHLERLYKELQQAERDGDTELSDGLRNEIRKREPEFSAVSVDFATMKPVYFNTGCCCYVDGDITGIEIADGEIRLIKWTGKEQVREVLRAKKLRKM